MCLEELATEIFDPGERDPYMLFEHCVRAEWRDRIPAVCHDDGSARLQTIDSGSNPILYRLISSFYNISGIPLLCNTSGNY